MSQRLKGLFVKSIVCLALALPAVKAGDCCTPAPCEPAPCAPTVTYKTVMVNECVPEQYTTTRTVYKAHQVEEAYTAYKIECVPEQRVRTVTTYKTVAEIQKRTRTVCDMVPTVEDRIVTENHWVCKPVTTYTCKTEDHGHYECRQVPVKKSWFAKKKCCDPCNPCCEEYKTEKVWVPCKVTVQVPCTKMVKVCETRQVATKVTVCKAVPRTEEYTVTVNRCVPETKQEAYTVNVEKKTAYQATRTVTKCVPVQETVTCTRMVSRCVEKQVAVCEDACSTPCCGKTSSRRKCCK